MQLYVHCTLLNANHYLEHFRDAMYCLMTTSGSYLVSNTLDQCLWYLTSQVTLSVPVHALKALAVAFACFGDILVLYANAAISGTSIA